MADFTMLGTNGIIVLFIMVVLLGIVIGSFLNVCIFRIPKKEDIAVERSHCMHCGHVLQWYELIPVFSFLIQGGKCRSCKKKISWQYPLVESLNAILWVAVVLMHGLKWETILFCLCASVLIVIAVIDERTMEIPFGCNVFIAVLGVIRLILDYTHWYEYVIGFFTVSLLFQIIIWITKGRGMGGGDVKLMAAAGLLLGWKQIIFAMFIGCVLGSIIHCSKMIFDKKKEHVLAFGPYLAAGIYIVILFGEHLVNWYINLMGL